MTAIAPPSPPPAPDASHGIEMAGIEPIADAARHGRPRTLFTLWFGANVQFATLSVGALSTAAFGLDLVTAAIAIVIGTLFAGLLVGALSVRGARLGVPQLIQARRYFGWFGNLPAAFVTVVNGIGWYVVDTMLGIFVLRSVLDIGLLPALLVMAVVQLLIPLLGYRTIHRVERYLSVVLLVVFVVISVYGFGHAQSAPASGPAMGVLAAFLLTVSVTSSRGLGWALYASDYSRYLPSDTPAWKIIGAATGGSVVAGTWIGVLGAALGTTSSVNDPTQLITGLLPHTLAVIALCALLCSTLASTVIDLYSGSMAALVAGLRVPRWASVVAITFVGVVATWFAARNGFAESLSSFLTVMAYWLGPWTGVALVAMLRDRRRGTDDLTPLYDRSRRFGPGLPAVLTGVAATIPFIDQPLFTGPLAALHPGLAGVGHFVGFVVGSACYLALSRTTRSDEKRVRQ